MCPALIDAEFVRQNVTLKKPGVDRLVMLSAVVLPAQFILQYVHRLLLHVWNVVKE